MSLKTTLSLRAHQVKITDSPPFSSVLQAKNIHPMRPNQPSHEMKTFIPRDKANHPVRPIALSRPFLHQLKINPYLCHRLGDTPVVPTSCIKGNPVRSRNSARYCKATLPRPLTAATEHTENILQNDATVLQTAGASQSGGREGVVFRRAESGNLPWRLHSQRLPGVRKTSINLTFFNK